MNVISTYKYAHISAFKAREVTREIQGLPVSAALDLLAFTPRKAAALISKTLKSAIANAENNNNLRAEALVVREAVVGEGPTLKRFQPKARGSAGPIRKRSSHIRIVVTDEIEIKTRESRKPAARKKAGAPRAKSGSKKPAHGKAHTAHTAPAAPESAPETTIAHTPEAAAPESTVTGSQTGE
jgi:large subunit ribosomal protein L22